MGVDWSNRSVNDLRGVLREILGDFIKEKEKRKLTRGRLYFGRLSSTTLKVSIQVSSAWY